jgi:cobalt-zinc-cadmium efflux system membrane fusion protein
MNKLINALNRMRRKTVILSLPVLALSLFTCREKVELKTAPFTLTDTMLARCEFYTVKENYLKNEFKFYGKIVADNNKMAQVYPAVGGVVLKIDVELGDYVKQGQVLATIRSSEVAEFQKERYDAQNNLALAEKNLQVAHDLFEGKLASEKDVLAAEKDLERAKNELSRINEVYGIYNLDKGSIYNITAPISGFVVAKDINQNELLRSDKGDVLFSIAEINEVWVLINVNESDIEKVKLGYDAEIKTISFPNDRFYGKVDKIFNAIDPETKAMKARVKIDNPDFRLKPEMNATIVLRFSENRKMVAVPSAALIFDKSRNYVMRYFSRDRIKTRLVDVFRQVGDTAYILSGLQRGEKIITRNSLLVYDALND